MGLNAFEKFMFFAFFSCCLFQLYPESREDYPFSSFGMYRYANRGEQNKIVPILVTSKGKELNFYDCVGAFRFNLKNQLHDILLERKRGIDKKVISSLSPIAGDPLNKDLKLLKTTMENALQRSGEEGSCPKEYQRLFIHFMSWKDLALENYLQPDFQEVVDID